MLCAAGLLTLVPATAAARAGRPDPGPPGDAAAPRSSPLYRSGTQVRPHPAAPRVPEVSALSWVVADAGTGDVLAANDAHRELPPASTLKTLFALTVLPALPGGIRHEVGPEDLSGIGPGSSLVGVVEGQTYRVSDLWNGVFLNSGNDAVHVLASLTGGWSATAARMQAEARALGARDTHVRSPDGYDAPGQVSSAYDLAVFGPGGAAASRLRAVLRQGGRDVPRPRRELVRDHEHQPAAHRGRRRAAVPGADRGEERLHQQRGQHAHRRRPPRRTDPGRHGDEPAGGRRPRRLRGGPGTARLGLRGGRRGRPGGLTGPRGPPAPAGTAGRTRGGERGEAGRGRAGLAGDGRDPRCRGARRGRHGARPADQARPGRRQL
ncbi:LOW QUALITY PROTEIN: D-alanyl-D-alanine carboxypeptidase, partial [Streptomyces lividans TK24]